MDKTFKECPKCGLLVDITSQVTTQRKIVTNVLAATKGTTKLAMHFGARLVGKSLGAIAGPTGSDYGGRIAGMAMGSIIGPMKEITFSDKITLKCPYCGHQWKLNK